MSDPLVDRYGRWALITGASSGIGASFADAMARRGFSLILVARRGDRLREAAIRLAAANGVEALAAEVDLTEPDAIDRVADVVGHREIGVLVNNAGFGFNGNFLSAPADNYDRMITLNCIAPVHLTHRLLPGMLRRKRGAIVMVSSTAAYQPVPYLSVYAATKAFDLMLGEGLYAELRGSGVDVMTVSPGLTRTEFASRARMGTGEPRGADPAAVAEAALARLGRRMSFIHGFANKLGPLSARLFPRGLVARATASAMPRVLFKKRRSEFTDDLDRLARGAGDPSADRRDRHDAPDSQPSETP